MSVNDELIKGLTNYNIEKPYFLNTVIESQIPLVFVIYDYLMNNTVKSTEDLSNRLDLDEKKEIKKMTSFLRSLDLYREDENKIHIEDYGIQIPIADKAIPIIYNFDSLLPSQNEFFKSFIEEIKFKILLLSKFSITKENDVWNKQAFFYLFYLSQVTQNKLGIQKHSPEDRLFFKSVDEYLLKNDAYIPFTDKKKIIEFNSNKFNILFGLYEYLGLVKADYNKKNYTFNIDKNLLELLIVLIFNKKKTEELDFETFFNFLATYIPYNKSTLKVPFSLAYSFYLLKIENKIDLSYKADYKIYDFKLNDILDSKQLKDFNEKTHLKYTPLIK